MSGGGKRRKTIVSSGSHHFTVVVAVDFGTTGTGYAYSFVKDATKDIVCREPGGQQAEKAETCVLLDRVSHAVLEFGAEARAKYCEHDEEAGPPPLLFDRFKMLLRDEERYATAADGTQVELEVVIYKTLEYVRREAVKEVNRSQPYAIPSDEFRWVLTVPAIWTDNAKAVMRRAAYRAGMIDFEQSDRLVLALEPESACLDCEDAILAPGHRIMVLDCGGGTVDITLNQVMEGGRFREIEPPSGGAWGSTEIDRAYERTFLEPLFGKDAADICKLKASSEWLDTSADFVGKAKKCYDGTSDKKLNFASLLANDEVPFTKLDGPLREYNAAAGSELVRKQGKTKLVLTSKFMDTLFSPVIQKIESHVSQLLRRHSGLRYIFLVGGFSESGVLQKRIQDRFGCGATRVIVPSRPGLTVLRGAVKFGRDTTVFATRKAKFSYGISLQRRYDKYNPDHADREYRVVTGFDGIPVTMVDNCFSKMVTVGEDVDCTATVDTSEALCPGQDGDSSSSIPLYASPMPDPRDTKREYGMKKLGVIHVTNDPFIPADRQSIKVKLNFGATEIKLEAYNAYTGSAADARLDFS